MSIDQDTSRPPLMIRLLSVAFDDFSEELERRLADTPYSDLRISHGCVFGNIDPDGSRLTDLAERARKTKQSVGEVTSDLEQDWVERFGAERVAALREALEAITGERVGAVPA